ncbi:hypothetical protein [Halotia branconii]|uniref:FHA domain containing protein n=1 Tax=Halotia branconii CENA392 TaxID=1539056 RepID=A0AAJ6NTI4_9CYAN|nr:hypothetical protein [Halotia branconii]WGV26440.1 hypothetical protein QI031_02710 [Halotia branconii CENA392]
MNSWQKKVLDQLFPKSFTIFRWLITLVLILSLTSCGKKAVSQEVSLGYGKKPPQNSQISQQFSEVSPPDVLQELRSTLEVYRPQVTIVTPQADEVLSENTVTVSFQVKDLPIFKNSQWELGPHLHVILDNQPYIAVYDLSQPLVLPNLSPGTHTLRVFASRPWHESFKNEGAYAETTFHILTKTDDHNPDPTLPVLTYSRPKGDYGAEPILLDFYLTNAPLRLVAKDNLNNQIGDWRIRCTINGESFVLDRWQPIYLKGFKPGKNWVKLEFLDNQGNPVKNVFNTTVRLINYQPKGKDTLSRIVRGELQADEVRGIVDQNYTQEVPVPTVEKTPEPQIIPETEVPEIPPTQSNDLPQSEVTPTPEATELPQKVAPEPEKPRFGRFFNRPRTSTQPSPSVTPTPSDILESPAPEPQPEVTPTPEPAKPKSDEFFNNRPSPSAQPSPNLPPTLPEIIEPAVPEPTLQLPETPIEPQPEVSPTPESSEVPEKQITQPQASRFSKYFQRRPSPTVSPVPETTLTPTQVNR